MTAKHVETHCDPTPVNEMVARLQDAGYHAVNDYDGACCHKKPCDHEHVLLQSCPDHHHDHFVTIRRLPLRDAERLLPRPRR